MITFLVTAVDEFGRRFTASWQPEPTWWEFSEKFKMALINGSIFRRLCQQILDKMGTAAYAEWSGVMEVWEL